MVNSLTFTLVVVCLVRSCDGVAAVSSDMIDSTNNRISRNMIRRVLQETATANDDVKKLSTSTKVDSKLNQEIKTKPDQLVKAEKNSSKIGAWLKRMNVISSKRDKFFILATILLFPIAAYMVASR
ncbi:RxLR-like protein [Plasmopara halstedii]|uniref:Secreted RxLR effector protein RXLR-C13 n=1 Tax=Plasmopara halstedii TaxID=4781 RepID=RLR13_PLAHL|nr:RxLR-like protein [Plasmopara halstedii]A0A0P1AM89.1 RecName: Full=Secreted RxLR effector protein RXLR-C13; Flags: Precursor [Plasmopara halstedii]CEG42169.1 RxLR-like protein [Plasmopara halstedii]|eukprot:XP_024578538.1 RxLR-like protein [Plasmopara halstedii]